MKALKKNSLLENGLTYVEDQTEPVLGHDEVMIKVTAASICGTDIGIYDIVGRPGMRNEMLAPVGGDIEKYRPITLGHEFCGEVVEVGRDVPKSLVQIGDYVTSEMHITCGYCQQCLDGMQHVCQNIKVKGVHDDGAFADFVTVPARNLINLEYSGGRKVIPPRFGAFLDALGNGVHIVMEAHVAGKTVAVLGLGAQGLMSTAISRTLGASRIYATDFSASADGTTRGRLKNRFELAQQVGADFCFDMNESASPGARAEFFERVRDENGGGGDIVLEMGGAESALKDGGEIVKNGGKILLLGIPAKPLNSYDVGKYIVWKGVTMQGIFGRRMFTTWHSMLDLLAAEKSGLKDKLEKLIAPQPIPLSDFERGFELVRSQEAVKVLLVPSRTVNEATEL